MKHLTAFREDLETSGQSGAHLACFEPETAKALIAEINESERILAMLNSPKCVTMEAGRAYFVGHVIVSFERDTEADTIDITASTPYPPLWRRILGVFAPKYLFKNT